MKKLIFVCVLIFCGLLTSCAETIGISEQTTGQETEKESESTGVREDMDADVTASSEETIYMETTGFKETESNETFGTKDKESLALSQSEQEALDRAANAFMKSGLVDFDASGTDWSEDELAFAGYYFFDYAMYILHDDPRINKDDYEETGVFWVGGKETEELFLECFPDVENMFGALNSHDGLVYDQGILEIWPATGEVWAVFEGDQMERETNRLNINGRIVQYSNTDEIGEILATVQISMYWNGQNGADIIESVFHDSSIS